MAVPQLCPLPAEAAVSDHLMAPPVVRPSQDQLRGSRPGQPCTDLVSCIRWLCDMYHSWLSVAFARRVVLLREPEVSQAAADEIEVVLTRNHAAHGVHDLVADAIQSCKVV